MSTETHTTATQAAVDMAGIPVVDAGWTRPAFAAYVDREIAPHAGAWDRAEAVPMEAVRRLFATGWLGALVPREHGGAGVDMATFGVLNEELGRGCSSVRSLLTVHSMCSFSVLRWGGRALKERWLPRLATGETIGAFALSEPGAGSDAASITTEATLDGDAYVLNGTKKWTTFGQIADLYLVFAQSAGKPIAMVVERATPGVTVEPLRGISGTRASLLAQITFDGARVPVGNRLGGPGFGLGVAMSVLEIGRFSVASGSVGILQAALDATLAYATSRKQFGQALSEHQLVRKMITEMSVDLRAARLLCQSAAAMYDAHEPGATEAIFAAKYFASTAAMRAALDACQAHGAAGCTDDYPVERLARDARVMEIIEGSTQIMQVSIAGQELAAFQRARG